MSAEAANTGGPASRRPAIVTGGTRRDRPRVAAVVCFLAGPEASYVNGAVIPVDGAKSAGIMKADRYQLP